MVVEFFFLDSRYGKKEGWGMLDGPLHDLWSGSGFPEAVA